MLYTDTAACVLEAAAVLNVVYPNVIQFTCLAHGLQRVAKEIRVVFAELNKLIQ
jgi:hypothetical protein